MKHGSLMLPPAPDTMPVPSDSEDVGARPTLAGSRPKTVLRPETEEDHIIARLESAQGFIDLAIANVRGSNGLKAHLELTCAHEALHDADGRLVHALLRLPAPQTIREGALR